MIIIGDLIVQSVFTVFKYLFLVVVVTVMAYRYGHPLCITMGFGSISMIHVVP
jgi:hypothetical protein